MYSTVWVCEPNYNALGGDLAASGEEPSALPGMWNKTFGGLSERVGLGDGGMGLSWRFQWNTYPLVAVVHYKYICI